MPELAEFQEVFATHGTIVVIVAVAAALIGALVTRWVDRSRLDASVRRVMAYQEEVRQLNDVRAELLSSLEERGDEVRRMKAELAHREASRVREPTTWGGGARPRG